MCLAYSHPIEFHHCDKVKVGWFWLQHKNKSISFTCHFHGQSSAVVEVWPHTPCHCHGHNQPNILPIFKTIIHWQWCYHGMVAVVRNNYINICLSQEKCTDQQSHIFFLAATSWRGGNVSVKCCPPGYHVKGLQQQTHNRPKGCWKPTLWIAHLHHVNILCMHL